MKPIQLYTIGFTQKTAEQFFGLLDGAGVTTLVDTRLNPDSQLSGFARKRDLPYLLARLISCAYVHRLDMAPEETLLKAYREDKSWERYEVGFKALLEKRQLIAQLDRAWWEGQRACLLCSEHEPDFCHRRLVAEYLAIQWGEVTITHLM
jgi:uncharacterized protein (DUF488 family)